MANSYHVSPQQELLWRSEPEGPSARAQAVLALDGTLDGAALEHALGRVVERHESLRTTFAHQPGIRVPLQVVRDKLDPSWVNLDLRSLDRQDQESQLEEARVKELERPFDFLDGPLVLALLARRAENRHTLVLTVSALSADAASVSLVLRELAHHYGGADELVADPLQYADFSAWQRELQESEDDEARAAAAFWTALDGATGPSVPFAREATSRFIPGEVALRIDRDLVARIEAEAARYGATAPAFLQTAWHVLLARVSGETQIVLAYVGSERRHADLDGAIGAFSRPVPVVARGADTTFAEALSEVEQARADAGVWQDYKPGAALERLRVGYVAHDAYEGRAGDLRMTLERLITSGQQVSIWLACAEGVGALEARLCFDPSSFDIDTIQRVARHLELLLSGASVDAGVEVGELPLLDETDRERLLVEFRGTAAPLPAPCVHELIAAHAASSPSRAAVIDEHGAISYADLDARANQLAHVLVRGGVGPDVAVGLCTDRSVEMIVGLLGILKAGGAYVPLHHEHPPARLAHQLAAAGARSIVTQEGLLGALPEFAGDVVCLDRDRAELEIEPSTLPDVRVSHQNLVYVIYTSGSTGAPKGVGVTHGNLVNYAADIARQTGADAAPLSFGVVTSISTDLGNTSVFGALCSGGTVVLISPVTAADAGALAEQLTRTPIDVLKITPSHAGALLAGGDSRVLPRRCLVIGGERAPWDLVTRVRALSSCEILNHYGPTEATVGCCTFVVGEIPGSYEPPSVPIGRPVANTSCYLLDRRGQLVPIGVEGRLHVGGAGVARGYVGLPDLTAERFLEDPFSASPGARMYDTGDLARWLPDGNLEFLGRADEQVKIRGYRVEPAEVETALRSHVQVREAVVVARAGAAGDVRLVAYCAADGTISVKDLRSHLSAWLPEFMIPEAILVLDDLPRTPSGKIDRLALPDPETLGEAVADYVAPGTPLEETVAAIWSQVLGVERVGIDDDFFALGGHSLLATQVVAQVRSDFAIDLPLHSLFSYPTVESLSAEIVRMMGDYEQEETAKLMAELEGLSDEEAERLLRDDVFPPDPRQA